MALNELIRVEKNVPFLDAVVSRDLADFERRIKELKEAEDELKARILAEMEEKDIRKIETADVTITRIDATERETFDSKKFRADNPDLYDSYISMSSVKASVRIKLNEKL